MRAAQRDDRRTTETLVHKRLILCMGAGGVGKTSVAAALAVRTAQSGRRCALITVDPARRLRSALGIEELSAQPTAVPLELEQKSRAGPKGSLAAMTLDTKRVFDDIIERTAPSRDIAQAILRNPLYQALSNELGGSTEYMAMEKLHQLLSDDYETVIVDTPPGAHARDLLDAPTRITNLVDSGVAATLRTPAQILRGNRVTRVVLGALLGSLQRWIGRDLISDLSDFAAAFEPLLSDFRSRANTVEQSLRSASTAFVVVTTAEDASLESAAELRADLARNSLQTFGLLVNQVHTVPSATTRGRLKCNARLNQKLADNYADYAARAKRDEQAIRRAKRDIAPIVAIIPKLDNPVASLDQVLTMASSLSTSAHQRAR